MLAEDLRPTPTPSPLAPYDAVMLASFGGPDGPADVLPFLRNVTAGKGIPDERLAEVAEHYHHFGGASPINGQNIALREALEGELRRRGIDVPVVWGNRNWTPYTVDALRAAHADGARRVVALVTSAYASYSGCRQYREDFWSSLEDLGTELGLAPGEQPLVLDKVRPYFNDPGFVQGNVDAVVEAWQDLPADARLVFVTHSVPTTMEAASGACGPSYSEQHLDVAATVAASAAVRLGHTVEWELTYCSRSGPPSQPWLEPDVNDHLARLHEEGVGSVVIAPIGFVSDHMEVVYDLDTEAMETAAELAMTAVRAATVGTREVFVRGLVDLLVERAAEARALDAGEVPAEPVTTGWLPARPSACRPGCCRRQDGVDSGRPAACSEDPHA